MFLLDILSFTFLTVFLAIVMTWFNWKYNKNIIYLTAALFIQAFGYMMLVFFVFGTSVKLYAILLYHFYAVFLLAGPFLYFFVRGMIQNKFIFKKTDLWHFLPFVIKLISQIKYFAAPFSYKYYVASEIIRDFNQYKHMDFYTIYPPEWDFIIKNLHPFVYVVLAFILLYKFNKDKNIKHSHGFKTIMTWSVIMLSIMLIITGLSVYAASIYANINKTLMDFPFYQFYFVAIAGLFLLLIVLFIFYPKILYGITFRELILIQPLSKIQIIENVITDDVDEKLNTLYQNSENAVTPEMKSLCCSVLKVLEEEKLYLNKDFHMNDLCQMLKEPKHKIQQCICDELKTNFADLKTLFRVQKAIELLKSNENYTQDYIGQQSGFASESGFYTSFKKLTGLTPLQWKRQNEAK